MPHLLFVPIVFGCVSLFLTASAQYVPVPHSHNDYEHKRPLHDALASGFSSVEADIFLVNGELLVGHTTRQLKPERTLESLYLQPLLEQSRKNKGKILPNVETFYLWIDCKSQGKETYPVLQKLLAKYDEIITGFDGKVKQPRPVRVIVSGNRPVEQVLQEKERRYLSLDGRIADLGTGISAEMMPAVSDSWTRFFSWKGKNDMPEEQKTKLLEQIHKVHQEGKMLRYWGAPDNAEFWKFLMENRIDFINTDRLKDLRQFLNHSSQ